MRQRDAAHHDTANAAEENVVATCVHREDAAFYIETANYGTESEPVLQSRAFVIDHEAVNGECYGTRHGTHYEATASDDETADYGADNDATMRTATHYRALHYTATHQQTPLSCNSLERHTETHCNILQHSDDGTAHHGAADDAATPPPQSHDLCLPATRLEIAKVVAGEHGCKVRGGVGNKRTEDGAIEEAGLRWDSWLPLKQNQTSASAKEPYVVDEEPCIFGKEPENLGVGGGGGWTASGHVQWSASHTREEGGEEEGEVGEVEGEVKGEEVWVEEDEEEGETAVVHWDLRQKEFGCVTNLPHSKEESLTQYMGTRILSVLSPSRKMEGGGDSGTEGGIEIASASSNWEEAQRWDARLFLETNQTSTPAKEPYISAHESCIFRKEGGGWNAIDSDLEEEFYGRVRSEGREQERARQLARMVDVMLQCVAVCCSVLQCFAVCCSTLKCVAACGCDCGAIGLCRRGQANSRDCALQCVVVCCSVLQCVAVCCRGLQCVTVCCSMWQYVAVFCRVLQCVAVRCSVFSVVQYVAVCCSATTHLSRDWYIFSLLLAHEPTVS